MVREYSLEFKVTAVRLTQRPGIQVRAAAALAAAAALDSFTPEEVMVLELFQKRGKPYLTRLRVTGDRRVSVTHQQGLTPSREARWLL